MYKRITDQKIIEKQKELWYELDPILFKIQNLRTIIQNPVIVSLEDRKESYVNFRQAIKELTDYYQEVDNFVVVNMIEGGSNEN